jgi:hypothetical protein
MFPRLIATPTAKVLAFSHSCASYLHAATATYQAEGAKVPPAEWLLGEMNLPSVGTRSCHDDNSWHGAWPFCLLSAIEV